MVKNVAYQAGKSATFMPKPLFEENASGMHVHQSLFLGGENVMYDFNATGCSRARHSTTSEACSSTGRR